MGKKKPQKTKELSVAIAEASSTIDESMQQQPLQPQAPRKRGRPRKIVVRMESEEKKTPVIIEQSEAAKSMENSMEKGEANVEEQKQDEMQLPKGEPSRSRARRKSKPRKSS